MYSNYPQYPTGGIGGLDKPDDKLSKVRDPLLAIVRWVSFQTDVLHARLHARLHGHANAASGTTFSGWFKCKQVKRRSPREKLILSAAGAILVRSLRIGSTGRHASNLTHNMQLLQLYLRLASFTLELRAFPSSL